MSAFPIFQCHPLFESIWEEWKKLFLSVFFQDKADDMHVGVKSLALKLGSQSKLWLAGFATGVTSGLAISGAMCHQPWLYFTGVGVVGSHFAYQVYETIAFWGHIFETS